MDIFSYVVTHDAGFAPNPFGGLLTLATCKPRIRLHACKGDLIVGTGSTSTVGNDKLVYAARVSEVDSLEDYGSQQEYAIKRPSARGQRWRKHGDNIYVKVNGEWTQRRNLHHSKREMIRDLSGKHVLVCRQFWYFGGNAIEIPERFQKLIKSGPGHKRVRDPLFTKGFLAWLITLPNGRLGMPEMDAAEEESCCR